MRGKMPRQLDMEAARADVLRRTGIENDDRWSLFMIFSGFTEHAKEIEVSYAID